jgi:Uncharacterized protein conserved in bacteria with the myosin-like domain
MKLAKPAKVEISLFGDSSALNSTKMDSELDISMNKSQLLRKMTPTLSPNGHLTKFLDRSFPLSSRSVQENVTNTSYNSKSKSPIGCKALNDTDDSFDCSHKILKAASQRRLLEYQYKLMENRVRKLKAEDTKIKAKIKQTKAKTKEMIQNREKHQLEAQWIASYKKELEKSIQEKKEKIQKMKLQHEQKIKQNMAQIRSEKSARVAERKEQRIIDQMIREEARREEDIKNNERVWRIAIHQKNVENARLYHKLKIQQEAKKEYANRVVTEESKVEAISKKIKELEKLEMQLLENLKVTHNNHLSAFAEMQKVYETQARSRRTSPISSPKTTSASPFRLK